MKKPVKEGNYCKGLKRMLSIYVMFKNIPQVEFAINIFDTDMGKLHETVCILQAVELVRVQYKDERTAEKIKT